MNFNRQELENNIINELSIGNLKNKDEIVEILVTLIFNKTVDEIIYSLSREEQEKLSIIDQNDEHGLKEFFNNHKEKIEIFNDVLEIKTKETIDEFRTRTRS